MYKSQVTAWKRLVFLLLLTGAALISRAQVYPVQLSTLVAPPYSIYLPDYASPGGEKLRLVLLQRDLTVQGYRLRFEMKVQVNGITIMQTSRSAVPPPITLQPGIPTVLGGSDLSWYVQPQNLEFGGGYSSSTYEQTRSLPEGPITITFTAYDYTRSDVQVSAVANSFFYATRDNPPLLNYPACGMQVTPINPQFLNFSWLPQNTSSPNSALQTNYIFSLYAVLPAGYNFQDIVQSTRPVYSVTTQQPNLVYGPGEPPLVPGQSYAWRVQAVDATGRDIFRNNGYSETCNFIYSGDSSQGIVNYPAIQLSAASAGPAQGKISWATAGSAAGSSESGNGLAASGYDQYRLYYRKAQGNYDWFSVDVNDSMYRVFDLEPSTAYECRLQGHKNDSYGPYTDIANFTTDAQKSIGCTDNTSMLGTPSGRPLAVATGGMNITYGPWDVQLLTVQALGSPGQFKGTCKVTVPFMGAMTFNAKFDNLTIDDSRNVTAGNIVFLSQGLQAWIDSSIHHEMGGDLYGNVVSGTDTTNVVVKVSLANLDHLDVIDSSNGDIKKVILPDNSTVTIPDGMQELTIKDSSGNTYALDNQGNLTQLSLSDGSVQNFFANASNVAGLNTLSSGVGTVTFTDADSKYAFDSWKPFYAKASTILTSQYEKLSGGSGDYYVPQKAIGAGESDIVGLNIDLPDNMDEDSLVFATGKGTRLIWDPKDYTLNLIGGPAADAQEVYALYPKPGGGYYSLGKLLVSAYEQQHFTAVIVPVAGSDGVIPQVDIQRYSDSLNSIYNMVNVFWKVKQDAPFMNTAWDAGGDSKLTITGSSFWSNTLTGEPAALIKLYKAQTQIDANTKYIFVLSASTGSSGDDGALAGDMPRGTQFGFVFVDGTRSPEGMAVTIAHELGHGQFNLEHTFSGDIALGSAGSTAEYPNLEDYFTGINYRHLYKYQWNQVHQPGEVLGIFESDEAGQCAADHIFKEYESPQLPDGSTIYTPDGQSYKIKGIVFSPTIEVNGTLSSFVYNGKKYVSSYTIDSKTDSLTHSFAGYIDVDKANTQVGPSPWSLNALKEKGCIFSLADAGWQLIEKNADLVKMVQNYFDAHTGFLTNDNAQIRADILALVKQLPNKIFTINKDDNYVFLLDLQKLKERLQGILKTITAGNQQLAALIKAYKDIKGTRTSQDIQLVMDMGDPINQARCNISQLMNDQWHVHLINTTPDDPEYANFQAMTSDQRLDLLTIYYDAPDLTSSAWGTTGYNCSLTYFGEEIVDAVLKYSSDQDKYSIANLMTQNPDMLRRFYRLIDNKRFIIPDDHNFDVFVQELIKLSALVNKNKSKTDLLVNNPVIVWKDSTAMVELVKYVSFTDDGKIQLSSVNYDPGIGTSLQFLIPGAILADMQIKSSPAVEPMQIVNLVIPKPSPTYFPDLPQDPTQYPYTLQLPAISVAWAANRALNDRIQLGVDIALIALPIGDLFEAGNGLAYIWRAAKIVVPAADVFLKTEEGRKVVYELYGVYDNISDAERTARTKKADDFSDRYTKFTNLVNLGAMGEGMYDLYKSVRGSAGDIRGAHSSTYSAGEQDALTQIEKGLDNFNDALPDVLKQEAAAVATVSTGNQLFDDIKALSGNQQAGHVIMDLNQKPVVELLDNGSLQVDAVGELTDISDGSTVLKIEEGQTFVLKGSTTPLTEDLMIVKQADNSVVCVRGACFAAGTAILTAGGSKKIEDVRVNDEIESYDEIRKVNSVHTVIRTMKRTADKLVKLVAGSSLLLCTPEHPIYANHRWTPAIRLQIGDSLQTAEGYVILRNKELKDTVATVYNFEVAGAHTYFVGKEKVCVHNDCKFFSFVEGKLNDEGLYNEFVKRYSQPGNASVLNLFKNGDLSLDAWKSLRSYPNSLNNATHLKIAEAIIREGHLSIPELTTIIAVNGQLGSVATPIEAFLNDLENLKLYRNCDGYGAIISSLQKQSVGSADGANWVVAALRKYPNEFADAGRVRFEVYEGAVRRYDLIYGDDVKAVFYEFKSYQSLPPDKFSEQWPKDLANDRVTDLSRDLKWWFDKAKLDKAGLSASDFKTKMLDALEKLDYDDAIIRKFVRKDNPVKDDLIDLFEQNFDNIFLIK